MKLTIKWQEKEITFNEYTRAIDKWFKNILYKDFSIGVWDEASTSKFSPMVLEEANDFLVKSLTNLTDDEINSLSNKDYIDLLEECKKLQNPPTDSKNS